MGSETVFRQTDHDLGVVIRFDGPYKDRHLQEFLTSVDGLYRTRWQWCHGIPKLLRWLKTLPTRQQGEFLKDIRHIFEAASKALAASKMCLMSFKNSPC